jgi:HSP20 family molecular chaperone IbpA
MYGSNRPGRSWLSEIFGFDPTGLVHNPQSYGFEIERTDEGFRIEVPVAGFRPEEINVTVEDRQLTIEGRGERRRFTRTVVLPEEIDADSIQANVQHGLLTLTLPAPSEDAAAPDRHSRRRSGVEERVGNDRADRDHRTNRADRPDGAKRLGRGARRGHPPAQETPSSKQPRAVVYG